MTVRLLITALVLWAWLVPVAGAKIVHRERSLYNTILIDKRGSLVCLQFSMRNDQRNQSCVDQRKPKEMVFQYTRMMMASLLLQPEPKRILVVGLGGGTLPMALAELYPDAIIVLVEIDPAVVKVAADYFDFVPTANMRLFTQDARVYTKRAALRGDTYDLIMLDAFNGDYIPEHLMTQEYLEENRALMTETSILAANTFSISDLYHHESTTYQAVFGSFLNLRNAQSANRIIIATRGPLPARSDLERRARHLEPKLRRFGIRILDYPRDMDPEPDWDTGARVLTDQYSPANLLQGR